MPVDIISYSDLTHSDKTISDKVKDILLSRGIIGISHVPSFEAKSRAYVNAARQFSQLADNVKQQYVPVRDEGDTVGYELGAEWFKDENGNWQIDDRKASYYAYVPDHVKNKWPREMDLKTPYLELGELIFETGKRVLRFIGLDSQVGIDHDKLVGFGRMLHYHKEGNRTNFNPNWCGAHFDHGVFTGLTPAYYFRDGKEIEEPEEAGLFILPTNGSQFEKISAVDKSILLFQVGEFAQLATNDQICATKHVVKKAKGDIERYTFALFYSADDQTRIFSHSRLAKDSRYTENCLPDGSILYKQWEEAAFARYRAV